MQKCRNYLSVNLLDFTGFYGVIFIIYIFYIYRDNINIQRAEANTGEKVFGAFLHFLTL
jgi:hypothetical protein